MWNNGLKANGLWCTFLVFGVLVGMSEETNSSIILSTIASGVSSTSSAGNSSSSLGVTYTGSLSSTSPTFTRPNGISGSSYYYQTFSITVYSSGYYTFLSSSSIDTYGCLYDYPFYSSSPSTDMLVCDDDSGGNYQFSFARYLQYGSNYVLVVTTSSSGVTGSFSASMTTGGGGVTTTRYVYLSSSDSTFSRPSGYSSYYYYDSIQVTASTGGSYLFRSSSGSLVDPYGCLYSDAFYPSSPLTNKLTCDDDSGGSNQFQFSWYLSSYSTYILVVTSSSTYATGSTTVSVTGPATVTLTSYYPALDLSVGAIVGISIGSIVFCIFLVSALIVCQRRRHVVTRTVLVPGHTVYQHTAHGNVGHDAPPPYNPYSQYPKA